MATDIYAAPVPSLGPAHHRSTASPRVSRAHRLALVAIAVVGLIRGGFWVLATDVFSPVDEAQHYDYVRSMAEGDGPPVVGADGLAAETRTLAKRSSAGWWRAALVSPAEDDDGWGSAGESYEGVQPPLYYALLAPVYKASKAAWGPATTVLVLRLASLLLALLGIPAVYALARLAFPSQPVAWVLSPTVLVLVPGFNANLGALTNDSLAVSLGAAAVAAFVWSARARLPIRRGVVCGALVGLAALTKSTAIGLVPFIALAAVVIGWRQRSARRTVQWAVAAGIPAAILYAPWLIWNFVTYGGPSSAEQVDEVTGPFQAVVPRSLGGAWMHVRNAANGFWDHHLSSPGPRPFSVAVFVVVGALLVAGAAAWWRRGQREEAITIVWLGSAVAAVFAWMLCLIFVVFDSRSSVVGRHLYPALGPLVVAVAAAAISLGGRRLAPVLLALLAVPLMNHERRDARHYIDYTYTWGVYEGTAPSIVQSYADDARIGATVHVDAGCPVESIGLMFRGEPAPQITAGGPGDQPATYPKVFAFERLTSVTAVYRLPTPRLGPLMVKVDPPASLLVSRRDVSPRMDSGEGDPTMLVYCPDRSNDGEAGRFRQVYGSAHPGWVSIGLMRAWSALAVALAPASLAVAAVASVWRGPRRSSRGARERPLSWPDGRSRSRTQVPGGHNAETDGADGE